MGRRSGNEDHPAPAIDTSRCKKNYNLHEIWILFSTKSSFLNLALDNLNDYLGLRLRGLPFTIRRDDINAFFSNYNYVKDSVKLGRSKDGMLTGEGAILFPSEEQCKFALQERNG